MKLDYGGRVVHALRKEMQIGCEPWMYVCMRFR